MIFKWSLQRVLDSLQKLPMSSFNACSYYDNSRAISVYLSLEAVLCEENKSYQHDLSGIALYGDEDESVLPPLVACGIFTIIY